MKLDPKVQEHYRKIAKLGGEKIKRTKPPEYYAEIARKKWADIRESEGEEAFKKRFSKMGKKSHKVVTKRQKTAKRKKAITGISSRITKFLQGDE